MNKLDLYFPESWTDLSDYQLYQIFNLFAKNYPLEKVKIFALFKWNNMKVLAKNGNGSYLITAGSAIKSPLYEISPIQIAEIFPLLSWIDTPSDYPVRLERIHFHKALPADFQGVPFEKFLIADNLFQGYLATQDDSLLDQLLYVLYGISRFIKPYMRVNAFYWMTALKSFFSAKFNEFFQPANSNDSSINTPNSVEESMNAQIRALTKGDITKEKEILQLDTWRALEELNAQAREYREFNSKYNKK